MRKESHNDRRVKKITGLDMSFRELVLLIQQERCLLYEKARREAHLLLCEMEGMDRVEKRSKRLIGPLWIG